MQVKPGYKQSEVGVIPEDWEVKSIAQIAPLQRGFDLPISQLREGPYPVVYSNGVMAHHERAMARGPGVVTGRSGTLGKIHYVETDYWPHNTSLWVTRFNGNDRRFVYYLYSAVGFDRFASGSGVPTLNRNDAHEFRTALPPTQAEQEAIAEALSDADALIESLQQLLAKKRQLRQGARQELLTGKRRLPGFNGAWEVVKSGDIGRFRGGNGFPIKFQGATSGDYPFFKVSDMNNEENETFMETANNHISEALRKQLGATAFPANSIVFAKIGAAVFLERKRILARASCLDNNMAAFVVNPDRANFRFIHYVLLNTKLGGLVSTTALPSLGGSVLARIELVLPSLAEQAAIAAVLSDMDAEIAAGEAKLTKARCLKQGMMQELLTGRIRLV